MFFVFFVFRDSYVIYIWVMNILCTFHIFMYGYVTCILFGAGGQGMSFIAWLRTVSTWIKETIRKHRNLFWTACSGDGRRERKHKASRKKKQEKEEVVSVLCVSGFLCYLYMRYEHSMYISHIHVRLCNTCTHFKFHYFSLAILFALPAGLRLYPE